MPLREGKSKATVSANIAELVRSGYTPKMAAAIAFARARKKRRTAEGRSNATQREHADPDHGT